MIKHRFVQIAAAVFGIAVGMSVLIFVTKPHERIANTVVCLQCHSEYQDLLKKKLIHKPFLDSIKRAGIVSCDTCHKPHGEEKVQISFVEYTSLAVQLWKGEKIKGKTTKESVDTEKRPGVRSELNKPLQEFCYSCHKDKQTEYWRNSKYQHPPFKRARCGSCHEPHASDYIALTRQSPPKLCPTCHNLVRWTSRKNQHSPFKRRGCADCHSPHGTNTYKHLRKPPRILCRSCHRNIARQFNMPVKMKPFSEGRCPKCHNPHASNFRKLWQAGPDAEDLCFKCHDGSGSKYDVKQFKKKKHQMKPYKEGKCLDCHRPHASIAPWLWKIKPEYVERFQKEGSFWFCLQCHTNYQKTYPFIMHSQVINMDSPFQPRAGKGMCINCHVPHGSDNFGLVYKEIISLCTTCHKSGVFRGYKRTEKDKPHPAHPVGLDIKDPWRGNYLRCSSCHNPMGTGNPKLRRKPQDELCIQCHNPNDPTWIKDRKQPKRGHNYYPY